MLKLLSFKNFWLVTSMPGQLKTKNFVKLSMTASSFNSPIFCPRNINSASTLNFDTLRVLGLKLSGCHMYEMI